jgi:bla regulator protein BlaR1
METIVELLKSPGAHALGWTLIHSLWQGFFCFLLGIAMMRFIPSRQSAIRYVSSVGVLVLMLISSIITFIIVYPQAAPEIAQAPSLVQFAAFNQPVAQSTSTFQQLLRNAGAFMSGQMGLVSAVWMVGALFFLLRIVSGYWYIGFIRRSVQPVGALWQQQVDALAARLDIQRFVVVAQSELINAPIVLGYLKPAILVPVGMFSGLTTEQLEAIFVHELMHIRRGDYLVNLAQTILEAIYFFNPFAWMLSASIRREREHCCDDGVVSNYGNAIDYVRALATLEEVKLSRPMTALSLAEDKNQLLNRIRRIMEKSVHRYSSRDRMVPAVLLVVGVICASWLTIQSRDQQVVKRNQQDEGMPAAMAQLVSDTTTNPKSGAYYHYSVTTVDKDGKEDTKVVEGYSEDGNVHQSVAGVPPAVPVEPMEPVEPIDQFILAGPMEPMILKIDPFHQPDVLVIPPTPGTLPMVPFVPPMPMKLAMDFNYIGFDTIPGSNGSWENFGREFEESFRERFGDFYQEHEQDMKEMMKELETKFGDDQALQRNAGELTRLKEMMLRDQEWSRNAEEMSKLSDEIKRENLAHFEDAQHAMDLARIQFKIDQARLLDMSQLNKEMERLNHDLKEMEDRMQAAQDRVHQEAVKDGYLKKGEKINNIHINDDSMEINGKKIKPADAKRYREIMDDAQARPDQHRK